MAYRDAIVVTFGRTSYSVDADGNVKRIGKKFNSELTETMIQKVRLKAADLRAVRDESEQRNTVQSRRAAIRAKMEERTFHSHLWR